MTGSKPIGSGLVGLGNAFATVSAILAGTGLFIAGWIFSVWLISAVLVAVGAHHRGRFAPLWLFFAVVLTPLLAGLMLLLFPDRSEVRMRRDARHGKGGWQLCPSCGEAVRREALRCRFCLTDLARRGESARPPRGSLPELGGRRSAAGSRGNTIIASEERVEPRLQ